MRLTVLFLACLIAQASAAPPERDEYEVYKTLLATWDHPALLASNVSLERCFLEPTTSREEVLKSAHDYLGIRFLKVDSGVLDDQLLPYFGEEFHWRVRAWNLVQTSLDNFLARSRDETALEEGELPGVKLVTPDITQRFESQKYWLTDPDRIQRWKPFAQEFPGAKGFLHLSRVCFSEVQPGRGPARGPRA